jgi:hypothetical protein
MDKLDSKIRFVSSYTNKNIVITEWSTVFDDRKRWINESIDYINRRSNIIGLISTQGPSKSAYQKNISQDQFTWDICNDDLSLENIKLIK